MDPYLEKLKAQLATAEARKPKNAEMIIRYKNEIQRIERLAGLTKGSEKNVKGLHAALLPLSKPVTSFGATAMAYTPASAMAANASKPDLEFWKRFEAKIADGTIHKNDGRSYDLSLTPAQKAQLDKLGGTRTRKPRPRQRRHSARNRKTVRSRNSSRRSRR